MVETNFPIETLQNNMDNFWLLFQEQTAPLRQKIETLNKNLDYLDVIFAPLIKALKPLEAFKKLGENQFSYWRPVSEEIIEEILSCNGLNTWLEEKIEDSSFIDYNKVLNDLNQSEVISNTNKVLLKECFIAKNDGLYNIALLGLVAIFDGTLSSVTLDEGTGLNPRLRILEDKIKKLADNTNEEIKIEDVTLYGTYYSWKKTMEQFKKNIKFKNVNAEPQNINRHWIAHGRKNYLATKLDCCKMINALYSLVLLYKSLDLLKKSAT